jgi:DNA-binding transcriptional MerR regulator
MKKTDVGYTIKQVSMKVNLSPYVLRYYEKEGLLPRVSRNENGNRRYSENDLEWLGLIRCLKNTGMSIRQIREFIDLSLRGSETLRQRRDMLVAHKRDVESRIQDMYRYLEKISHKIEYFTEQTQPAGGRRGECGRQCGL